MIRTFSIFLLSFITLAAFSQSDISGNIYYANTSQPPIDIVRLYRTSLAGQKLDSTYSNQNGYYVFHNVPAGQFKIRPAVTKPWGGVSSVDALLILKHFAGMTSLSGLRLAAADVDASGTVTSLDALQTMQRFLGMNSAFQSGDWAFIADTVVTNGTNPVQHDIGVLCYGDINASYVPPALNPCQGTLSLVYGGLTYHTVAVGNQCWLKENLNIGTMINGPTMATNDSVIEKYCYNTDTAYCTIYGGLYQWNEMMQYNNTPGSQGICPQGFHVPADAEWASLTSFLGGEQLAGGKMKETGLAHWIAPNAGATNESGLTILGASIRYNDGSFYNLQHSASIWSSTEAFVTYAGLTFMNNTSANNSLGLASKSFGLSVRCLKD